jgi:hypothetical protein
MTETSWHRVFALLLLPALILFAGCGGAEQPPAEPEAGVQGASGAVDAASRDQLLRRRVAMLEETLTTLERQLEELRQQHQDRIRNVQDVRDQAAVELNAIKGELGMPPTPIGPGVAEVPEEPTAPTAQSAEAEGGLTLWGVVEKAFLFLVCIGIAVLVFIAIGRFNYDSELEDDDGESVETREGTISLSAQARRQGSHLNPPDDDEDMDDEDDGR